MASSPANPPRRPGASAAALLALLAGCALSLPEHLSECGDDLCRHSWVSRAGAADPLAAAREVAELGDPISAAALVKTVSSAQPDALGQVCDILPPALGGDRCDAARARPHLWQVQASARAADPAAQSLPTLTPPDAALLDPSAAALGGDAARCLDLSEHAARAECLFQASEATSEAATGQATALCLSASPFTGQCLLHLLFRIGSRAPISTSDDAAGWASLSGAISSSAEAVPDPEFRARWREQLWGNALRYAYDGCDEVTGNPLDHLPAEALPHVRAAGAWRLWTLEQGMPRNLSRWVARLNEVLGARTAPLAEPPKRQVSRVFRDLWPETLPGEEALPRVAWFVGAARATSPDPSTDALLALLEAAARAEPPGRELLGEALTHRDATVRWSAARLLGAHDPGRRLRQAAFNDPDPLVAARARYRRGQGP